MIDLVSRFVHVRHHRPDDAAKKVRRDPAVLPLRSRRSIAELICSI